MIPPGDDVRLGIASFISPEFRRLMEREHSFANEFLRISLRAYVETQGTTDAFRCADPKWDHPAIVAVRNVCGGLTFRVEGEQWSA